MYPAAITISSRVWETAAFLFLIVPLTLLWIVSLADAVWRKDLARYRKAIWLVVVFLFPVMGTLVYVLRRPGWTERAVSMRQERPLVESQRHVIETLGNLAVTLDLTRLTLQQSTELLQQITDVLSDAGATANFALPLTRFRPLGPVEHRMKKVLLQVRSLGFTMEQMSESLGTNAGDLRGLARRLDLQLTKTEDAPPADIAAPAEEMAMTGAVSPLNDTIRIPVRGPRAPGSGPNGTLETEESSVSSS